jgi:DNA-binding winged helix-turn-helix (wHTH) protein/tetratricopeptide (TPR) repeat protein
MDTSVVITRFGPYELHANSRELYKFNARVKIRPQVFRILSLLAGRPGQVVTREELQQQLWPSDTFVDFEPSLNTAMKELRAALCDAADRPRFIETLPRLGYRFIFPIEVPAPETEPSPNLSAEPDSAVPEMRPVTRPASGTRWGAPRLAAAALLFLVTLGVAGLAMFRHSAGAGSAIKTRPSIAVLGFRNMSQVPEKDWMSTAMAEMVRAELASGQQVRVIAAENVARMNRDLSLPATETYAQETLARIRNRLGTDMVVSGSYLALPDGSNTKLRIVLEIQDTHTGEIIASVKEDGSEGELPELVSAGGDHLRQALRIGSLSALAAREVRASAPSNSEAERFYADGLASLQSFDALTARSLFEKAIVADPGHALSHSALAESLSILGYDLKAQEEAKTALELSGNLPREDRLSIEGRYRELMHDPSAASEIYRTLHNFFPDCLDYGLRLAKAQTQANHAADALETVKSLRALPGPESKDPAIDVAEASAAERLGDMKRSQKAAAAGIARAQVLGSGLMLANALSRESWAWLNLGEMDKTIADEIRARELWLAAGDARNAAKALHGIAIAQREKGDLSDARKSFEEALKEFRRIGANWDIASCSHNLGVLLLDQGQVDLARASLEEALHIQRAQNDKRGVSADLDDLGNVALSAGQLALARQLKEQALQGFREIGDKRAESIALLNLGEVLYQQGELVAAAQHYRLALNLQKEISYKVGLAYSLVGLAEVLTVQDRLDEALSSTEQSAVLRQEDKDGTHSAESDLQLAEIALHQRRPGDAEALARKAAAVFEKNQAPGSAALAYSMLARALVARNELTGARTAADRAMALVRQSGDRMVRIQAGFARAEVDISSGNSSSAERSLKALHEQALSSGYATLDLRARLLLSHAELQSGKQAEARAHLAALREDARRKGFRLIARQASANDEANGG